MQNIQANKKLNYSNERIYKGLIDLEPNTEEIVAAAEQQELQKRKQAAKFLVNFIFKIIFLDFFFNFLRRKNIKYYKRNVLNQILWNYLMNQ